MITSALLVLVPHCKLSAQAAARASSFWAQIFVSTSNDDLSFGILLGLIFLQPENKPSDGFLQLFVGILLL